MIVVIMLDSCCTVVSGTTLEQTFTHQSNARDFLRVHQIGVLRCHIRGKTYS